VKIASLQDCKIHPGFCCSKGRRKWQRWIKTCKAPIKSLPST